MKVGVIQSNYIPWRGYFDFIDSVDLFVFHDDLQYTKNDWRNRNRIKTPNGPAWLTVPVKTEGRLSKKLLINQIEIRNDLGWQEKHLKSIRMSYARAPFFEEVMALAEPIIAKPWRLLVDLDLALVEAFAGYLGISRKIIRSSETGTSELARSDRLLALCLQVGANRYLSGDAAKDYLETARFADKGIAVEWHGYRHPEYSQLWGEFAPFMSIIDLLFNHGRESLRILSGRQERQP